jgi:hypothetical protein
MNNNLETDPIIKALAIACVNLRGGISVFDLSPLCGVPVPTLRQRLKGLVECGAVQVQKGEGRRPSFYLVAPWDEPEPDVVLPTPIGDLSRLEAELLRLADDWQLQPEVATAFNVAAMALRFGIKQKESE